MYRNQRRSKFSPWNNGFWTFGVVWFGVCLLFGPPSAFGQSDSREHHQTASVMEMFRSQTMDVDYVEAPAADVLKELAAATETNFLLHESTADENFDPETLVTLKLKKVRIATVLDRLLDPYQCTWQVHDGIVTFMSQDCALDHLQIKVFNVADLTAKIKPRTITRRKLWPVVGSGGGSLGGGVFTVPNSQASQETQDVNEKTSPKSDPKTKSVPSKPNASAASPPVEEEITIRTGADQLTELISETIDPDSWEQNGGNARINNLNGIIVVTQTNVNLRAIEDFLDRLRESGLMDQ